MSPANWWVNTNNKVYGPYSAAQMSRFIGEGRVIATTLVADKPEGAEWTEARYVPDLRGALHEERTTFHTQRVDRRKQIASANMLVWADIVTGASMRFEHELRQLGPVAEVIPGLYILRTTRTAGVVRNALSQALDRGDKFLVMDSSRDRLAWFNLGPEVDVHIRNVWNANIEQEAV